MKKILYIILLLAELFFGSLFWLSLWSSNLIITCISVIVALVALSAWQIFALVKTTDQTKKRKILRNIALIFLLPTATFIAVFIYVAVGLIIAFS